MQADPPPYRKPSDEKRRMKEWTIVWKNQLTHNSSPSKMFDRGRQSACNGCKLGWMSEDRQTVDFFCHYRRQIDKKNDESMDGNPEQHQMHVMFRAVQHESLWWCAFGTSWRWPQILWANTQTAYGLPGSEKKTTIFFLNFFFNFHIQISGGMDLIRLHLLINKRNKMKLSK